MRCWNHLNCASSVLCNRLCLKAHTPVYPSCLFKWLMWKKEGPCFSWSSYNASHSKQRLYCLRSCKWFMYLLNDQQWGQQQKTVDIINCREMFNQFDNQHLTQTLWKKHIAVVLGVFFHSSQFSANSWGSFNFWNKIPDPLGSISNYYHYGFFFHIYSQLVF